MIERDLFTFINAPQESLQSIVLRKFSFVGIPTERGSVFRAGTALGPDAIRKSSTMYYYNDFDGLYDPERQRYVLEGNLICDLGNIEDAPIDSLNERITQTIIVIKDRNSIPITLGGDHSITYPILCAFNEPFDVVHLDAHCDYQRYDEADTAECGLVMRRVSGLPNVNKIIHAGIRGYLNSGQGIRDSIKDGNVMIPCDVLKQQGVEAILNHLGELPLYITFDSDVLDPSICPGTTVPEPGGIDFQLAQKILTTLSQKAEIIGADFVEVNPNYDPSQLSTIYISKLILDMMAEMTA